jgi:hypothetical protein
MNEELQSLLMLITLIFVAAGLCLGVMLWWLTRDIYDNSD